MTSAPFWIAAVAVAALLYFSRRWVLRKAGWFLVVNDEPSACDAIVLLNGNISTRPYRAAELHKQTGAPVLIARLADTEEVRLGIIPNISDATRELLQRRGVAADRIEVLTSNRWIAGTWAEAVVLCDLIRRRGWRAVTIVTDASHTRRARWTFRKVMRDSGVAFSCVATPYSLRLTDRWWRSEYGLVHVIIEYIKFLHYLRLGRRGPSSESDLPLQEATRRMVTGDAEKGGDRKEKKEDGGIGI